MRGRAAGLLALVVQALVVACSPTASMASHSPAVADDHGPPPAGVPLIYLGEPGHAGWYTGFDWTGTPRGTVKLAQPVDQDQFLTQAPDGSAFFVAPFKGLGGQLLDRLGRPLGALPANGAFLRWADDGQSYCSLSVANQHWELRVSSRDGSGSSHAVALDSANLSSGIIALQLAACSPAHDRAVVTYGYSERPSEVWFVRPSDGAITRHDTVPANVLAGIAASGDGLLLAYNSNASTGYLRGRTAPNTNIERVSDRPILMTSLDPTMGVIAFSADDSLALVSTSPWASGVATHLAVVSTQSGAVFWRYEGGGELAGYLTAPTGGGFVVMLQSPGDQSWHATVDAAIVHADGTSTKIAGQFVRP